MFEYHLCKQGKTLFGPVLLIENVFISMCLGIGKTTSATATVSEVASKLPIRKLLRK